MSEQSLRSTLRGPTDVDYTAVKRNAFNDHGVLIVDINDARLSWDDRELLKRIGKTLFGFRESGSRPSLSIGNSAAGGRR